MRCYLKELPLTRGKAAIVDDEDYEWLSQFRWIAGHHVNPSGKEYWYARRCWCVNGKRMEVSMHNAVSPAPHPLITAHWNLDGLDNRRSNLYVATRSNVAYNRRLSQRDLPRGMRYSENGRKIAVAIGGHSKGAYLGRFETIEQATTAYQTALAEIIGED